MALSLALSLGNFLIFVFHSCGPHSTIRFACAIEWLNAMWVAMTDPGIVSYSLSSTEVLSLGLTSVSSDVSLSVSDLLEFVSSSYFFSAIRYVFVVFFWAQIKSVKCMVNVLMDFSC